MVNLTVDYDDATGELLHLHAVDAIEAQVPQLIHEVEAEQLVSRVIIVCVVCC